MNIFWDFWISKRRLPLWKAALKPGATIVKDSIPQLRKDSIPQVQDMLKTQRLFWENLRFVTLTILKVTTLSIVERDIF